MLGVAIVSAVLTNAGRASVPTSTVSRSPRAGEAGFGTGVARK